MSDQKTIQDYIVYDEPEKCPYLPDRVARMPLRMPISSISLEETDDRFEQGERRSGRFVYRTHCDNCNACEPIRIPVAQFKLNRTQNRVFKRGESLITTVFEVPQIDDERVMLFNKHRNQRGLSHDGTNINEEGYSAFLVDSCLETVEMSYWLDGQLVGVAIVDLGETSISAVYCFYDPDHSDLSLGVYSILKQLELCRQRSANYLYLGFYVRNSIHMEYKQRYRPPRTKDRWQMGAFRQGKVTSKEHPTTTNVANHSLIFQVNYLMQAALCIKLNYDQRLMCP